MKWTIAVASLMIAAAPAAADFQAGLEAYQSGNYAAALNEWRPYAERGDAHAEYNLGLLYSRGEGVPRDYAEAARWYLKAAEQGIVAAQFNLGILCAKGEGVAQDHNLALEWYRKAAEAGLADAENNIGTMYDQGEGVERNVAEAEKWYLRAAEKGLAAAQFNLGVLYDQEKNYEQALKWYRRAAQQGHPHAMKNLGVLYYNAQGTPRDLMQAYMWFSRAEATGDRISGQLLRATAKRMKTKDVIKAQRQGVGWTPVREGAERNLEIVHGPAANPAGSARGDSQ
jgi:TPR repeat protein